MNKRVYRFFGGLLTAQERWLNKMSDKGYQLLCTTKTMYEFAECEPSMYRYRVEFIGNRSKQSAEEYVATLESYGYRVHFKNINLNYSVGKCEYRPWAEKGGQWATEETTLHRELLIIEKKNDGQPFELCSSLADRLLRNSKVRTIWLLLGFIMGVMGIVTKNIVWLIFALIAFGCAILYHFEVVWIKIELNSKKLF